jgi:hypothetical protein
MASAIRYFDDQLTVARIDNALAHALSVFKFPADK